eukprot:TRINITY_DN224_c0_g1_i1.p1 TRINITY_DN224_c0_g1~~TRINITY_DN224_c0_g1_i1.p1  ORF type:complete len:280 (-),score=31.34 TRINITY_DN224_c0_g1_i1:209-1048(-)
MDVEAGLGGGELVVHIKSVDWDTMSCRVSKNTTVLQLKQLIMQEKTIQNKILKLFSFGKLLGDDYTLAQLKINNGHFIHCAAVDVSLVSSPEPNSFTPLQGIDRLQEMGFPNSDLHSFRSQFRTLLVQRAIRVYNSETEPERRNAEQVEQHLNRFFSEINESDIRELEDRWVDELMSHHLPIRSVSPSNQRPNPSTSSERAASPSDRMRIYIDDDNSLTFVEDGTLLDLFYGMVLGFLLSFIMLFWLSDDSLTRRTRFGILAGLGCNLAFGLIQLTKSL